MTTQPEPYLINKTDWPEGPWMHEPDRVDFSHAGFPCLALRNSLGAWCGYVALPPEHRLHGVEYMDIEDDLDVHGRLTYSSLCAEAICHVPEPGQPDNVWWLGFDCGHSGDLIPATLKIMREVRRANPLPAALMPWDRLLRDRYRDLAYVQDETRKLAEQLKV